MQTGELSEPIQERSVWRQLHMETGGYASNLTPAAPGETVFVSIGPLPGYEDMPWRQVTAAANAFAAQNVSCRGLLLEGLLPPSFEETSLREMNERFQEEAGEAGLFFHDAGIQLSAAVSAPQFFVTAYGFRREKSVLLHPGQDLIMTREIALAGTAALARNYEKELCLRFPPSFVARAKGFDRWMSVSEEAKAVFRVASCPVHCVAQGGIFRALWEMAECAQVGVEVELKKIPVRQESIELCEYFDINPYAFYSAGALLIGTDQTEELLAALEAADVPAAVIGKVTDNHDRVVLNGESRRFLERPGQDEWWRKTGNERTDFKSTGEEQQNGSG